MATGRPSAPAHPSKKSPTKAKPTKATSTRQKPAKTSGEASAPKPSARRAGKATRKAEGKGKGKGDGKAESGASTEAGLQGMVDRWNKRSEELSALFDKLGASDLPTCLDLALGRFWLQAEDGKPKVVASAKLLLSYSHKARSILCGWANESVPKHATIAPVAGIGDSFDDCTEGVAWGLAMHLAEASGADYLHHIPGKGVTIFIALNDVRAATAEDTPFVRRAR